MLDDKIGATPDSKLDTMYCPKCRHEFDCFRSINAPRKYEPGDIAVCAYCRAPLVFDIKRFLWKRNLILREMTPEEYTRLMLTDPDTYYMLETVRENPNPDNLKGGS